MTKYDYLKKEDYFKKLESQNKIYKIWVGKLDKENKQLKEKLGEKI